MSRTTGGLTNHSAGVISPVSLAMHLAAAVEVHGRYGRRNRPCVVLAGGRDPTNWEAYPHHQYIHRIGALPCCDHGGCWKSRVYKGEIGDNDEKDRMNYCTDNVESESGQRVPRCMHMISVEEVVRAIRDYLEPYNYYRHLG